MTEQEELKHIFSKVGVGSGPEPLAHMCAFGEYLCHIQRIFEMVVIVHIRRNRISGYENDTVVFSGDHYTAAVVTADAKLKATDTDRAFSSVLAGVLSGDIPVSGDAVRELYKLAKVDYKYSMKLLDLLEVSIRAEVTLNKDVCLKLVKVSAEAVATIRASTSERPIDIYTANLALASWGYINEYYLAQ